MAILIVEWLFVSKKLVRSNMAKYYTKYSPYQGATGATREVAPHGR